MIHRYTTQNETHKNTKSETRLHKKMPLRQKQNAQTKQDETKSIWKDHWICFVMTIYCCWWNLHFSVDTISSVTTLEKSNFSSASEYQLKIASWLGIGAMLTSSSHHWDLVCLDLKVNTYLHMTMDDQNNPKDTNILAVSTFHFKSCHRDIVVKMASR